MLEVVVVVVAAAAVVVVANVIVVDDLPYSFFYETKVFSDRRRMARRS